MKNSKIKILHLEDEATDVDLISRFLKKNDVEFESCVVDTKDQFEKALREFKPEIVLSDHSLPAFNSMEALEMLRSSGLDIPFILVTGAVSEEFGVIAIMNGVDDYILKDRLNRLPVAIKNALEKYAAERERKKEAQEKILTNRRIEESEKQYVQLVHNLPAAVYTCDVEGRIVLYNKAAMALWGRTPESGRDRWCGSLKIFDADRQPIDHEVSPMARAVKERRSIEEEMIIERADGSIRYVRSHPSPKFDSNGAVTGATNMIIDITETKKAGLETLLLVERLQLKNKELGQFGYMISHNLRAPIARILGLASIFDVDPKENKFITEKITEATHDLDEIVRDINVVVSARDTEHSKKEVVIFENQFRLIRQVLANEIAATDALITTNFCDARATITIRNYIYSILFNLFSNALKFRDTTKQLKIDVSTHNEKDFVVLMVKDNGIGIDLEKNGSKLFGLYKKFNHTISGKGIGLHLVKTQVEALGGKVEADSKVQEGSEFRIYLPKNDTQSNG